MISVIICTRNRAQALARTLESLRAMTPPARPWEVIVVDNGSSDATREVIDGFARTSGLPVRYAFEGTPGLSRARNRGLSLARGDLLVFTDDDVVVDRTWLEAIVREFAVHGEMAMVFGRTRPPAGGAPGFSTKDKDTSRRFAFPAHPGTVGHGNNMSIRRSVVDRIGAFDIRLGAGTPAGSAEDTDYVYRVLRAGGVVGYAPAAVIVHDPEPPSDGETAVWLSYARGRGAFYGKYVRRGDLWAVGALLREWRGLLVRSVRHAGQRRRLWPTLVHMTRGLLLSGGGAGAVGSAPGRPMIARAADSGEPGPLP